MNFLKGAVAVAGVLLLFLSGVRAEVFVYPEGRVSLTTPEGWVHDDKDTFGYVIRPVDEERVKVRMHNLRHQGATTAREASKMGAEKVAKARADQNQPAELVSAGRDVVTESGIRGWMVTAGEPAYLDRYYFQRPDKTFFCVCVYFYGKEKFRRECEGMIGRTLRLTGK